MSETGTVTRFNGRSGLIRPFAERWHEVTFSRGVLRSQIPEVQPGAVVEFDRHNGRLVAAEVVVVALAPEVAA